MKIIVGNWKENPESLEIAEKLVAISEKYANSELLIAQAVPSIFASKLNSKVNKTKVILQNISLFESGSHTGEISVSQMQNSNIQASIVGHSETRLTPENKKGDEDKDVNLKLKNLIKNNCNAILCIGEYAREENSQKTYLNFLENQLNNCLKEIKNKNFENIIIAYEPVWAIGKNATRPATNEEIQEIIDFIKKYFSEKSVANIAVLYGGSVDENNAKEILEIENLDGLLIGRASCDEQKWEKLLQNISGQSNFEKVEVKKDIKFLQITDLNLQPNTSVLLRLDLNVPVNEKGEIVNDYRIQESLPTIKTLQDLKVKTIILAHKEKGDFKIVAEYLKNKIVNFKFIDKVVGPEVEQEVNNLQASEVLLLDNLRLNEGEKANDENFAKILSSYGNYYINEAFSASHRKHASIVGIPKILGASKCALGPKFVEEITQLNLCLNPKRPMLLIVGGAKFDTKLAMLEKFLNIADNIFIGGALAHTFWKEKFNFNLGKSLIDEEVKLSEKVLQEINTGKIILPKDVMIESREIKSPNEILENEKIVDFGDKSLEEILILAKNANTIVWNGPLGFYEAGFETGTKNLLKDLSDLQKKYPEKVIILGGGDTVTEIDKINIELNNSNQEKLKFTHVSTGGGAMIEFLSNGILPGINAVENKNI